MITKILYLSKARENNRRVSFLFILFFTTIASCFAAAPSSASENITYTRSQVDSLITMEVRRQVDTQLIDLKIHKVSTDVLKTYISEENNHLSIIAIIITILVTIVGVVIPLYINRRYEKLIDEKLKEYKEIIDKYIKESEDKVQQLVEKGLLEVDTSYNNFKEQLTIQQNYTISLIRALNNENDDVKLNMLNELINKFEKEPFVASAYNCRGNIYFLRQEYERSIIDYTKAIEKSPSFADAYYNRGNALSNIGNYLMAISDYLKAMELNPIGIDYYESRGDVYLEKEDYDKAIEDYTKVITSGTNDANVYFKRGRAYSENGNLSDAIDDYTSAIKINPELAEAYYYRGNAFFYTNNYDLAISDFSAVILMTPENATAALYLKRGQAFLYQNDNQSAVNDCSMAIRLNPENGEAYYVRGTAYMRMGKTKKAKADFKRAKELGFIA